MELLTTSSAGTIPGNSRIQKREIFPSINEEQTQKINRFESSGGANLDNKNSFHINNNNNNNGVISSSNVSAPQHGPGIFFDMQKGEQYQKMESYKKMPNNNRSSSQCQFNGTKTSGFSGAITQRTNGIVSNIRPRAAKSSHVDGLPQGSAKLYSPYEYLSYASKISESRENYLNGLQQLGYVNAHELNQQPFNEIVARTEGIIHKSYSLKYLGVIDGNMGVLSKRVQIKQDQNPSQQHSSQYQQHNNHHSQHKQQQIRQKKLSTQNSENLSNISLVPSKNRPDLYNSYLITSYALPKHLRPIVSKRDQFIVDEKHRLAAWHAEKLKNESNLMATEEDLRDRNRTQYTEQGHIENSYNNMNQHSQEDQQEQPKRSFSQAGINTSSSFQRTSNINVSQRSIMSSKLKSTAIKTTSKLKQVSTNLQDNSTQSQNINSEPHLRNSQQQLQQLFNKDAKIPSTIDQANQNYPPSYSRLLNKIQSQHEQFKNKIQTEGDEDAYQLQVNNPSRKERIIGSKGAQTVEFISSSQSMEQIPKSQNDFQKKSMISLSRKQSEGIVNNQSKLAQRQMVQQQQVQQQLKFTQNQQLQDRFDHISGVLNQNKLIAQQMLQNKLTNSQISTLHN